MSTYPSTASLPETGSVVARYLLDEASGNATAETGGLDLTDTGSVGAGTGYSDLGASFDNSRDFVPNDEFTHSDNATFDLTSDFTLSLLFNPDDVTSNSGLINKWSGASNRGYEMFQRNDGKFTLEITSDGTSGTQDSVVSTTALSNGTWYLLTGVFEASTRMELYIDGSSDATNTTSIEASVYNSSASFRVGSIDGASYANGQMNDLIIWNTALTDANVTELYDLYTTATAPTGQPIFFT